MAVITTDILLKGVRRDFVFEWLSDFSNHRRFIEPAFDAAEQSSKTELQLMFKTKLKQRTMGYVFHENDSSHGGGTATLRAM